MTAPDRSDVRRSRSGNAIKATNEEILASYASTGSVWRTAKALGMAGQTVHGRLIALEVKLGGRGLPWDDDEVAELRALVAAKVPVFDIATRLDRSYNAVACKMHEVGVAVGKGKPRKVPRGLGYDKASTARHIKIMVKRGVPMTRYCHENGLEVNAFVASAQSKLPDEWTAYLAEQYQTAAKACEGCNEPFIPTNGKQRFHSRQCASTHNRDRDYFGGKRSTTIGLAEGICQLCNKQKVKGLSSHHVLGKDNDPDNEYLVALCQGCHQVVTILGGRDYVDNAERWEALIILVRMRKHGARPQPFAIGAYVELDDDIDDDWDEVAS